MRIPGVKIKRLLPIIFLTFFASCPEHTIPTSNSFANIQDIKVGDMVLTHKNRFKKVLKVGHNNNCELWKFKAQGISETLVTKNHPFYVIRKNKVWDNVSRKYKYKN